MEQFGKLILYFKASNEQYDSWEMEPLESVRHSMKNETLLVFLPPANNDIQVIKAIGVQIKHGLQSMLLSSFEITKFETYKRIKREFKNNKC